VAGCTNRYEQRQGSPVVNSLQNFQGASATLLTKGKLIELKKGNDTSYRYHIIKIIRRQTEGNSEEGNLD
jgi:hypothetical protein